MITNVVTNDHVFSQKYNIYFIDANPYAVSRRGEECVILAIHCNDTLTIRNAGGCSINLTHDDFKSNYTKDIMGHVAIV